MIKIKHDKHEKGGWRHDLHEVIFEADTFWGKAFDVILLIAILASVFAVMLESIASIDAKWHRELKALEWVLTIAFTIEYILRIIVVKRPQVYMTSFFGVVDLLAILPTYISVLVPGSHYLLGIRALRLLRLFRVFKLVRYVTGAQQIFRAMKASLPKITVFLLFVLTLTMILGSVMYVIEANYNTDFSSIPKSMYWAIVTLTTVGYGDISPVTDLGQAVASFIMLLGYAIIAVPTGITTAEIIKQARSNNTQVCRNCGNGQHDDDAKYCMKCGEEL